MMSGILNGVHNGKRASEPRTRFPMGCTFPPLHEKKWTRILMVLACVGILSLLALSRTQMVVYRPVAPPPPRSSEKSRDRLFNDAVDVDFKSEAGQVQMVESAAVWNAMLRPVKGHGPCSPVLERASQGRWVPRDDVTSGEREAVEQFLVTVRGYQKLPVSVQRKDNKCGNTNMAERGSPGGLNWFKAMCNPAGPRSCCYSNNTCVSLPVEECRCNGCQDLRQQVHAELSTWVPHDPQCKLKTYRDESDMCPLLQNFTIHVVGDSFMRQVFISLLGILRSRYPDGAITGPNITRSRIEHCNTYLRYFSKCADVIPENATECGGTVHFRRKALWRASQIKEMRKLFESYVGKPNSFIIFGLGIHDMYQTNVVISKILKPLLAVVARKAPWPQLIWVAPQAPGILKTPLVKQQQRASVVKFNSVVTPFLKARGIPVLDGYSLTPDSLMSYDGTHYGKGLNDLKAQLLFNYFSEIRAEL